MPTVADQPECFVFDACALIAYLNDEPGADKVEGLLNRAHQGHLRLYVGIEVWLRRMDAPKVSYQ